MIFKVLKKRTNTIQVAPGERFASPGGQVKAPLPGGWHVTCARPNRQNRPRSGEYERKIPEPPLRVEQRPSYNEQERERERERERKLGFVQASEGITSIVAGASATTPILAE